MKSLLLGLVLLASYPALALNISNLAGKYKATPVDLPYVTDTFEIFADGTVTLREELTPAGKAYVASYGVDPASIPAVDCQGSASMVGFAIVYSKLTCNNGQNFTQTIDLAGVDIAQASFEAYVITTANEASGVWLFERL